MMKSKVIVGIVALTLLSLFAMGWIRIQGSTDVASAQVNGSCPAVQNTPFFTIVYGMVTINGTDAPQGTVVEARNPRGDTVGCFVVSESGNYGTMYVYGEDTTVDPPIPGMRAGEEVDFFVDGVNAEANPALAWANDKEVHQVDLNVTEAIPTDTPNPSETPMTPDPTTTSTAEAPSATPTEAPTLTPTPSADPDLQVQLLDVNPEFAVLGEPVAVTVTLKNEGAAQVADPFYLDLYADHRPTGCDDVGWDYNRIDNLGIDQVVTVQFTHQGFDTTGIHNFYAQVDSGCAIEESVESNNVYGPLRVQVASDVSPPEVEFSASPLSGAVPLEVQFTDLSTGEIDAWLWDFGDEVTSTMQSPTHTYCLTGTFSVSLTVSGPGGSQTTSKPAYIAVQDVYEVYLPLVVRRLR